MLAKEYNDHVKFLRTGKLPGHFASTKSNFIRSTKGMALNKKGVLLRNQKFVVKRSERDAIFAGNFRVKSNNKFEIFMLGIQDVMQLGTR